MKSHSTLDERTALPLREAAEWRMLGLLFECPGPHWRDQIQALAQEVTDPLLRSAAEGTLEEASEGDYHYIFGPGGPAPAREVSYHETIQLGYLISELTSYYEAFSYHPATVEALDHVSVEAGFVGYLRLKEAFGLANGQFELAAVAGDAAKDFVRDHLSCVAQPLAKSLAASGVAYLAAAGEALLARVGPPRTLPVIQSLAPAADCVDSTFDCGVS
ncbi:MAG: hypothetical protein ACKV2U_21840 [Bryobacteraceae bacterium]